MLKKVNFFGFFIQIWVKKLKNARKEHFFLLSLRDKSLPGEPNISYWQVTTVPTLVATVGTNSNIVLNPAQTHAMALSMFSKLALTDMWIHFFEIFLRPEVSAKKNTAFLFLHQNEKTLQNLPKNHISENIVYFYGTFFLFQRFNIQ